MGATGVYAATDGWVTVPVDFANPRSGGDSCLAEDFNEIVEAITERQTFMDTEDPLFATSFSLAYLGGMASGGVTRQCYEEGLLGLPGEKRTATTQFEKYTGYEDTDWGHTYWLANGDSDVACESIWANDPAGGTRTWPTFGINTLRSAIGELIPYFANPGAFNTSGPNEGHWDNYTVLGLLPNGWERIPDETDEYYNSPATIIRLDDADGVSSYDPPPAEVTYGNVKDIPTYGFGTVPQGDDADSYATNTYSEIMNQMRDILNKLVYVERSIARYTDGTAGGLHKPRATAATGLTAAAAVDNWELGLPTVSPCIDTLVYGWEPSPFNTSLPNYVIGTVGRGYRRGFYFFEWTQALGIVQIRTKVKLFSYYQQAAGNQALNDWTLYQYHNSGATPGTLTADDWDWGTNAGSMVVSGVHDGPDWASGEMVTPEPAYPAVGLAKFTNDRVYLQFKGREDQPTELDGASWPGSPTEYVCKANYDESGTSTSRVCLVRVAFEYDDRTP